MRHSAYYLTSKKEVHAKRQSRNYSNYQISSLKGKKNARSSSFFAIFCYVIILESEMEENTRLPRYTREVSYDFTNGRNQRIENE